MFHEHNCIDCKYLGSYESHDTQYDIYKSCSKKPEYSVLIRHSSNGPDYLTHSFDYSENLLEDSKKYIEYLWYGAFN